MILCIPENSPYWHDICILIKRALRACLFSKQSWLNHISRIQNWISASKAKYHIFAPKLYRVFLRKMLFLGSSKIVFDTQLDVFPLSKCVVLTTLTLKIHLFSYPLFLSWLACAATYDKLTGKEKTPLFFFFPSFSSPPSSCENTGNESLFVGKDWNILAELSRDPMRGSTEQNSEVSVELFVKCFRGKELQGRRKKVSRQSCDREIYGVYRMAGSGTQNISKDQEHKNNFFL